MLFERFRGRSNSVLIAYFCIIKKAILCSDICPILKEDYITVLDKGFEESN